MNRNDLGICHRFALNIPSESDSASQGLYDKTSLRTMLAVIDHLRHQQRPVAADRSAPFLVFLVSSALCPSNWPVPVTFPSLSSCGTVCDSNFWLELNYLEVAKAAQSCSAHFTALLYTEIYMDKIKASMEESRRCAKSTLTPLYSENSLWVSFSLF